jgi:hypothetical protein
MSVWEFDPGQCNLVRQELSGPGVAAIGETRTEALERLAGAEEHLYS